MFIKLVQLENNKYFQKTFFFNSANIILFIVWGGVNKSGDEKLVTLYHTNLKLPSIMSFWVYHSKGKLDDKIRRQISIKTLKLCKNYF